MKKNVFKKILIIGCIIILFGTSFIPLVSSSIQKKLNSQTQITKEDSVEIDVFNRSTRRGKWFQYISPSTTIFLQITLKIKYYSMSEIICQPKVL